MTWTDAKVRLIAQMWTDGYPGSVIAEHVAKSRAAVIAKLHRMGKVGDADHNKNRAQVRAKAGRKRHEAMARTRGPVMSQPLPAAKPEPSDGIPLQALTKTTCRWPLLDNPPQLYCGRHTATGQYCPHHSERAFTAGKGAHHA